LYNSRKVASENGECGQETDLSAEEAVYLVPSPDPPQDGTKTIQQPSNTQFFLPALTSTGKTLTARSSIVGLPSSNPCNDCVLAFNKVEDETVKVCALDVHPMRCGSCYDVSYVHLSTSDCEKVPFTVSHRIWTGRRLEDLQHMT